MRFADNPFSNPFREPSATGSVGQVPQTPKPAFQGAAPAGRVTSSPLAAPVAAAAAAPAASVVARAPAMATPVAGTIKGWTAQGGSPVSLGTGETLTTLSNRYGVPEQALRSVNGIPAGQQPAAGSNIIIPVYNAVGSAAAPAMAAGSPRLPAAPSRTTVANEAAAAVPPSSAVTAMTKPPVGQARMKLTQGAKPAVQTTASVQPVAAPVPPARVAAAADPKAAKAAADKAAAERVAAAQAAEKKALADKKALTDKKTLADKKSAETVKIAKVAPVSPVQPAKTAAVTTKPLAQPIEKVEPAPAATPMRAAAPAAEPSETASINQQTRAAAPAGAGFRWPAKGRVISGFGKGGGNDGINIALPEGTPIKAAEAGEVAYAGNELKGYGNLVLIRHPDGWVSAYAHNGDLKVKRGDKIARGQTVATSGQTGNVSSPQLHFELRKGSTPVDPMPHLSGQ